jgi:AraC family transcriptional regulator
LAKIAIELERALARREVHGEAGAQMTRVLAQGDGYNVVDVICTCGPQDNIYEERRSHVAIAIVAAGTFRYRSTAGREIMTPGSLLLGNERQYFECGHEHGAGDRCIAFRFRPDYFERIAGELVANRRSTAFHAVRVPPLRETSLLVAQACSGVVGTAHVSWEEIAVRLAVKVLRLEGRWTNRPIPARAVGRVTRIVRMIESEPHAPLSLAALANEAGLSAYHFLRTFEAVTGITPHRYILRTRLREAAIRLVTERTKVIDVAFESGFGDVSNFNRTFKAEFGVAPTRYRRPR